MKAFLAAALITVFAFTANATTTHTKSDTAGAFKPHSAPAIELKDLDGNVVKLSDYAGKVVVVNFFATW